MQSCKVCINNNKTCILTFVGAVSGQPLPFGAVGGAYDADHVSTLDGQVVVLALTGHSDLRLVHGLLLTSDLVETQVK